jgi:hypothetical protein
MMHDFARHVSPTLYRIPTRVLFEELYQEEDSILHYLWGCPVAKRFWTSFNNWLSSALDLEVFELTPKRNSCNKPNT